MNLSLKNSPYFKASKAPRQMSENVPYCPTYSKNNANKGLMENPDGLVHELFPQLCELSPLQLQALELRLRGWPIGKIAQKLSLDRKTISRWCNHHPGFVAEFNRRQEEMVRQSALMHRRLLRKSFKVLAEALANENEKDKHLKVALALVNGSASRKLFDHQPGPTDEVSVVNKMASDEQRTWGTTDPYMEIAVHQDYAIRLAQMNFAPEPAPHSSETKP